MSEKAGFLAKVMISASAITNQATFDGAAEISGLNQATLEEMCEILGITKFGNTYVVNIAGIKNASLDISGNYDGADAGQTLLAVGTTVYIAVLFDRDTAIGATNKAFSSAWIVASKPRSSNVNGITTISARLALGGTPSELTS